MNRKGLALIEVMLIIVVLAVLIVVLFSGLLRERTTPGRSWCANNLKQIYTAMYTYSLDYKGAFPQVMPGQLIMGEDKTVKNLKPVSKENPFKDFPAGANHSVSENLWLLCRGEFTQPELFICNSSEDAGNKVNMRDIKDSTTGGTGPEYFVNFPWPNPGMTISYSFIQPWSRFNEKDKGSWNMWSDKVDAKFVLGADANNNSQPDFKGEKIPLPFNELKKYVNSTNHVSDGQNVLYGDGHSAWSKTSYTGIDQDNIYTALPADYSGKAGETSGVLNVRPKDEKDTVLIPNKDADLAKWSRKP